MLRFNSRFEQRAHCQSFVSRSSAHAALHGAAVPSLSAPSADDVPAREHGRGRRQHAAAGARECLPCRHVQWCRQGGRLRVELFPLLLLRLRVASCHLPRVLGGDVAVQWEAHRAEVFELRPTERAVRLAQAAHGVVEAPEAERVAACVNAGLVQSLEADGALEIAEG